MPKKSNSKGGRFRRPRKGGLSGLSGNEYSSSNLSASRGFRQTRGYTLAEEARNTAHNRRGAFARDAKLRYNPVTFISAGLMDPLKDLELTLENGNESQADQGTAEESRAASPPTVDITPPDNPIPLSAPVEKSTADLFTIDVTGDRSLRADVDPQDSEDSSEEVILFKGRDGGRRLPRPAKVNQDNANAEPMKLREIDIEIQAVEKSLQQGTSTPNDTLEADDYIPVEAAPKGGRLTPRTPHFRDTSDEEAAVIADYMANIQNEEDEQEDEGDEDEENHPGLGSHAFHLLRDLGGTDSEAVPDEVSSDDTWGEGANSEDQRRRRDVQDERMARVLARQEELGFGSDDILLFDGADSEDEWLSAIKTTPHHQKKGASKKAKIFQKKGQYPSAAQMADAFDDLDLLMDWHRPSLNNFKKGPPALDVSDSELEEAMNMAWRKDRLKKAEKKKAREALRSQGFLGKDTKPDDPRVKYHGGMSLDDLANELEVFLLGSQQQLSLPPFDREARKTIHAVANKFKIKSQSAGKGRGRYPVLYRTKATLPFDQVVFDRTFSRIKQSWFGRVDVDENVVRQNRMLKRAEARDGRARFKGTLTYREGDIVGQHATELGVENKGRAMLEKMGWTKGMALGSKENKGIMVPITHVVKKTKAGLGET
ncbi:hypothetical protein F4779DRAFT_568624 [Xylariaceae sp. FL0662B]|nr:hypothetical protein F4779DRAFT_568624 [Xylariaceae sp. FL0662B]